MDAIRALPDLGSAFMQQQELAVTLDHLEVARRSPQAGGELPSPRSTIASRPGIRHICAPAPGLQRVVAVVSRASAACLAAACPGEGVDEDDAVAQRPEAGEAASHSLKPPRRQETLLAGSAPGKPVGRAPCLEILRLL